MSLQPIDPLVTAVALSLYAYNVSPVKRAEHIYRHFDGACAEPDELVRAVMSIAPATELAMPSAAVYVQHALDTYQREAAERVAANLPKRAIRNADKMVTALRAVLLFYSPGWTEERREEWTRLTGHSDATTAVLCETVRRALS